MTYVGRERDFWRDRHRRLGSSIRAVGHINLSEEENARQYEIAQSIFEDMVRKDFPQDLSNFRVVDFGYGQGHYAHSCARLGFGAYVGYDLAAPLPHLELPESYKFLRGDVSEIQPPRRRFELVLCIDTIFHIVEDGKFNRAIRALASHVTRNGYVYIASTFVDHNPAEHVRHRSTGAFAPLELVGELQPWRDTSMGRFKLRR